MLPLPLFMESGRIRNSTCSMAEIQQVFLRFSSPTGLWLMIDEGFLLTEYEQWLPYAALLVFLSLVRYISIMCLYYKPNAQLHAVYTLQHAESHSTKCNYSNLKMQASNLATKLKKGTKVKITAKGYVGEVGTVKYVGPIEEKKGDGDYVGLELEKPNGKNNGTHGGKQYFKAKMNHGIFLKPTSLLLMDGTPVVPPPPPGTTAATKVAAGSNKLSRDLEEAQKTEDAPVEQKKVPPQKVEEAKQQVPTQLPPATSGATNDNKQLRVEIEELKKKVRHLEQENRTLKMQSEKVKYAVKQIDQGKQKQLNEQIAFYKKQNESLEKEKSVLKKKNAELNAELEELSENTGVIDSMTIKIENLEAKNEKLKQQLEAANSELKTLRMTGGGVQSTNEQLNENISILNETVTLLESDLKEMTEKHNLLEQELKKREASDGDIKKLERKLKKTEEELQQTMSELELLTDASSFAEKLTMDIVKKEEKLKETTLKLNEYLGKVDGLEGELASTRQLIDDLNQELLSQEELMDAYSKEIQQKNKHIAELTRQNEKYKKKLFDLSQSNNITDNSSLMSSQIMDQKQQLALSKPLFVDQYQSKYYNQLKLNNEARRNELRYQIQFSDIRNQVGVFMLNLNEAIPESLTEKMYPEVISILTAVKSANDKLYYIFCIVTATFINKNEIYSKENQELATWFCILVKEVITLYGCLHKLEFTLTTAESEDKISEALEHRVIKEEVARVNTFALEILERFADDNVSASVDLQPFISSIEKFDEINENLKRSFGTEYQTKMKLCTEGMETITNVFEAVLKYKQTNELGENAEIDNSLEMFVKSLLGYLKQCCMNPYIRFKSEMKKYLEGLSLISNILNDIGVEGNYHELHSLYSETENIKMLRETMITVQYLITTLENDLKDMVYPSEVSKIQTQLPGKFWQDRIKQIRDELLRVKELTEQKAELEFNLVEAKKKNLIYERDLKDKQSTKQLYEKKIGELQLKLEQTATIENSNKELQSKLSKSEDENKKLEGKILNEIEKGKVLQDEYRKIKEKYDTLQTETMMRNKKQKNMNNLSAEDVANLTIFKNAVKESNQLRTFDVKKKVMQLRQSPIFSFNQIKSKESEKIYAVRSKAFDQISKFTINDPFVQKKNPTEANLDSILLQIDRMAQDLSKERPKLKSAKVGTLSFDYLDRSAAKLSSTELSLIVN